MNVLRSISERRVARFQLPSVSRHGTAPAPVRRRLSEERFQGPEEMWWGREVHPEVSGPLRGMAELILWLLAVLAMIWLFAEFWLPV